MSSSFKTDQQKNLLYFTNFLKHVMLYEEFLNETSDFKNVALAGAQPMHFTVQQAT